MSDEYLTYDEEIIANGTPPLIATTVNYQTEDTPPPLVPIDTSPSSPGSAKGDVGTAGLSAKRRRRHKGRSRHSQCDAVLIHQLDPNRPELADHAGRYALESASQSEAEDPDRDRDRDSEQDGEPAREEEGMVEVRTRRDAELLDSVEATALAKKANAILAEVVDQDIEMIESPGPEPEPVEGTSARKPPLTNGFHHDANAAGHAEAAKDDSLSSAPLPTKPLDVKPPPLRPSISTSFPLSASKRNDDDDSSIATSPNLAKFAITPAEGDPDNVLPAMQKSPPCSSSVQSPESAQTLPSLQTALSQMSDTSSNGVFAPGAGHSPNLTRPSSSHPGQFGPGPGPYSHNSHNSPNMSPPILPSHPSFYRSRPREASMSTPSEYQSQGTPSSLTGHSPANPYPTPTIQDHRGSIDGSAGPPPLINGAMPSMGTFTTNAFKCTYPGCTAPPFQTQYLLNSHANVHSSSRPHFCPVKGCLRGPGGKGFKRKNEMIRHGLVHESPGYQCPFCPDQTHKYPRPDNLQRHVRVHHPEKDRDDPELRTVLAQRMEGGNRGRRRRI